MLSNEVTIINGMVRTKDSVQTKDEQYPEVLYNGMYYQATYSRSDQIWNVCVYKTKKRMDNDIADHIAINVDKDKAIAEAKRKINSYGR